MIRVRSPRGQCDTNTTRRFVVKPIARWRVGRTYRWYIRLCQEPLQWVIEYEGRCTEKLGYTLLTKGIEAHGTPTVFLDPLAITFPDPDHSDEEDREITIVTQAVCLAAQAAPLKSYQSPFFKSTALAETVGQASSLTRRLRSEAAFSSRWLEHWFTLAYLLAGYLARLLSFFEPVRPAQGNEGRFQAYSQTSRPLTRIRSEHRRAFRAEL